MKENMAVGPEDVLLVVDIQNDRERVGWR